MTGAKDFTQMTDEELAQACVRTGKNPIGESLAMVALLERVGADPIECEGAATRLWRDRKTATEILDTVRSMTNPGGLA